MTKPISFNEILRKQISNIYDPSHIRTVLFQEYSAHLDYVEGIVCMSFQATCFACHGRVIAFVTSIFRLHIAAVTTRSVYKLASSFRTKDLVKISLAMYFLPNNIWSCLDRKFQRQFFNGLNSRTEVCERFRFPFAIAPAPSPVVSTTAGPSSSQFAS